MNPFAVHLKLTHHCQSTVLQYKIKTFLKGNFPGGPVVKNPPANAGDLSSISGQPSLVPQLLSPRATTPEACAHQSLRSATGGARAMGSR